MKNPCRYPMEEGKLSAFEHFVRHRGKCITTLRTSRSLRNGEDDLAQTPEESEILSDAWNRIPKDHKDIYEYCASISVLPQNESIAILPMGAQEGAENEGRSLYTDGRDHILPVAPLKNDVSLTTTATSFEKPAQDSYQNDPRGFGQQGLSFGPSTQELSKNDTLFACETTTGNLCSNESSNTPKGRIDRHPRQDEDDCKVQSPYDFFVVDFCARGDHAIPNNAIISAAWEAIGEIERQKYEERHNEALARYELVHGKSSRTQKRRRSCRLKSDSRYSDKTRGCERTKRRTGIDSHAQPVNHRNPQSMLRNSTKTYATHDRPGTTQSETTTCTVALPPSKSKMSILDIAGSASSLSSKVKQNPGSLSVHRPQLTDIKDSRNIDKRLPLRDSLRRTPGTDGELRNLGLGDGCTFPSSCNGTRKECPDTDSIENIPEVRNSLELVPGSEQSTPSKRTVYSNPATHPMDKMGTPQFTRAPFALPKRRSFGQEDNPGLFISCDSFPFLADDPDGARLLSTIEFDDEDDVTSIIRHNCNELKEISFPSADVDIDKDQLLEFLN